MVFEAQRVPVGRTSPDSGEEHVEMLLPCGERQEWPE